MTEYVADRENVWPYGSHREEIVRCKDCELFEQYRVTLKGRTWEHYWCKRDDDHLAHAEPDGFCAWGVRRNDERA